jgi:hypothetical protein
VHRLPHPIILGLIDQDCIDEGEALISKIERAMAPADDDDYIENQVTSDR